MSVPDEVRERLKRRLWEEANRVGWATLSPVAKAKHYEDWTRHSEVGGVLTRYVDPGQVRVYIKDTLLKNYGLDRLADQARPFRVLGISENDEVAERYIKPHGRRLANGSVICWGRADDWKTVLMAVHERAFVRPGARPSAAVLFQASGRYHENHAREPIEDAARKLNIEKLVWLDA
jgi:hypothetical protein